MVKGSDNFVEQPDILEHRLPDLFGCPNKKYIFETESKKHYEDMLLISEALKADRLAAHESEQYVLGGIVSQISHYHRADSLKAKHFSYFPHKKIFMVITALITQNKLVSDATIISRLQYDSQVISYFPDKDSLERYVSLLAMLTVADMDEMVFSQHVQNIIECYNKRIAVERIKKVLIRTVAPDDKSSVYGSPLLTAEDMMGELSCLLSVMEEETENISIRQTNEVTKNMISEYAKGTQMVTETGLEAIDLALFGGFHAGRTYCIAAGPKMGKTTLGASVFYNQKLMERRVAYIALEMSDVQIHQRIACYHAAVKGDDFMAGVKDEKIREEVSQKLLLFYEKERQIEDTAYYVDAPGIKFSQLKRIMRSYASRFNLEGFFLDHIGLVDNDMDHRMEQPKFLSELTAWLERFAKAQGVWVAYMQQVNRDDKLYGSDGALQHSDMVLRLVAQPEAVGGSRAFHLVMERTRYTRQRDIGYSKNPYMEFSPFGPYAIDIIGSTGRTRAAEAQDKTPNTKFGSLKNSTEQSQIPFDGMEEYDEYFNN